MQLCMPFEDVVQKIQIQLSQLDIPVSRSFSWRKDDISMTVLLVYMDVVDPLTVLIYGRREQATLTVDHRYQTSSSAFREILQRIFYESTENC